MAIDIISSIIHTIYITPFFFFSFLEKRNYFSSRSIYHELWIEPRQMTNCLCLYIQWLWFLDIQTYFMLSSFIHVLRFCMKLLSLTNWRPCSLFLSLLDYRFWLRNGQAKLVHTELCSSFYWALQKWMVYVLSIPLRLVHIELCSRFYWALRKWTVGLHLKISQGVQKLARMPEFFFLNAHSN